MLIDITVKEILELTQECKLPNLKQDSTNTTESTKKPVFKVILTKVGDARLPVVKAVYNTVKLSLKEAKDVIDNVPTVLGETTSEKEALNLKETIEGASQGTEVTIEQC